MPSGLQPVFLMVFTLEERLEALHLYQDRALSAMDSDYPYSQLYLTVRSSRPMGSADCQLRICALHRSGTTDR